MRNVASQRASRPISMWECSSAGERLTKRVKAKQLLLVVLCGVVEGGDGEEVSSFGNKELWMLSGANMDSILCTILWMIKTTVVYMLAQLRKFNSLVESRKYNLMTQIGVRAKHFRLYKQ